MFPFIHGLIKWKEKVDERFCKIDNLYPKVNQSRAIVAI